MSWHVKFVENMFLSQQLFSLHPRVNPTNLSTQTASLFAFIPPTNPHFIVATSRPLSSLSSAPPTFLSISHTPGPPSCIESLTSTTMPSDIIVSGHSSTNHQITKKHLQAKVAISRHQAFSVKSIGINMYFLNP